jgi:hypothetical protein
LNGDDLAGFAAEDIVSGEGRESLGIDAAVVSIFSCELGGPIASLLGTGVDNLTEDLTSLAGFEGFALGRKLALVVSFRQDGLSGSGETFAEAAAATAAEGEDVAEPVLALATLPPPCAGEDFWKNEKMDCCLPVDAVDAFCGLAGVRAAAAAPPAAAVLLSPVMATRWSKSALRCVEACASNWDDEMRPLSLFCRWFTH